MKKKILAAVMSVFMVTGLLAGCGSSSSSTSGSSTTASASNETVSEVTAADSVEEASSESGASSDALASTGNIDDIKDAKVKIGLSEMSLTTEYQANLTKAVQNVVKQNYPNVELTVTDANADSATQVSQVENLISQGVDAILMVPYDRNGCMPAVEAAKDAGIPLIELCQETDSPDRTSFVGSLHYDSGEMLMTALAEKIGGKGNIVFLEGPIGQDSALARTQAGKDVLEKNYPDIKIVTEKVCDWDRAAAMSAVENIIQSGTEFDAIYAESDSMALGAMEAISGTEYEGKAVVGGIDMIEDAYKSVSNGGMYCSCFQNFLKQADVGVEVAVRAALGQKIEKQYIIPFELVTKDNAKDYEYVYGD